LNPRFPSVISRWSWVLEYEITIRKRLAFWRGEEGSADAAD